ncbi:hypothetical protein [Lactococcus termiticola]|uniref:PASTA domain-containing protein n=1 Tax=Lactococcus termiticola TaxID=2169526 RepID=A0A2R5HIH4_9LACT|nr:hypothetical protein [Lactococcus termiticola]GBG97365.1 hypothetical protein NtB2_01505 [Lactococcus termiticola]
MKGWQKILFIVLAVFFVLVIGTAGVLGRNILYKDYPSLSELSQKEVVERTNIAPEDNLFIKKLKNNALDDYLSVASTSFAKDLPTNEKLINQIEDGSLPTDKYTASLPSLKKAMKATDDDMDMLQTDYDNARLVTVTKTVTDALALLTTKSLEQFMQQVNSLADLSKTSAESLATADNETTASNLQTAIETLGTANDNISNFNQFITASKNYDQLTTASYQASFSQTGSLIQEFNPVMTKLSNYLTMKESINQKTKEIQALKAKVDKSKALTEGSVPLDNFQGMTMAQVKAKMQGLAYKVKLADDQEDGDKAIVTRQEPALENYQRIVKGKTVTLYTATKTKPTASSSADKSDDKKDQTPESSGTTPSSSTTQKP